MTLIRRAILALALLSGLTPAIAQVPAPVPALPDAERRTTYSLSASTCACAVNFALYGDSSDYTNWLEVWLGNTQIVYNDPAHGWTITSPSGPIANLARPITNAVLTFNSPQTGTVQIVGARRPRRTSQFNENAGVPARNINQVITDLTSVEREMWDLKSRMFLTLPGSTGGIVGGLTSGMVGPGSSTDKAIPRFVGTSGGALQNSAVTISDPGSINSPASGGGPLSAFLASAAIPAFGWQATGQPADQKIWDILAFAGALQFRAVNDANNTAFPWMTVTRGTGATVSGIALNAPVFLGESTDGGTYLVPGGSASPALTTKNSVWNAANTSFPFTGTAFGKTLLNTSHAGSHAGTQLFSSGINAQINGSGTNGPAQGDYALGINSEKTGWQTNAGAAGEIGGVYVRVRQNASSNSGDASGALLDVNSLGNSGFLAAIETISSNESGSTGLVLKAIDTQTGVIDTNSGKAYGFVATAFLGSLDYGIFVQNPAGLGTFQYPFAYANSSGNRFTVDKNSNLNIYPIDGTSSNFYTLRNNAGAFSLVDTTGSNEFFQVNQTGAVAAFGVNPAYAWHATTQPADQKVWDILATGSTLQFRAVNDANNSAFPWMVVNRGTGTAVSGVALNSSLSIQPTAGSTSQGLQVTQTPSGTITGGSPFDFNISNAANYIYLPTDTLSRGDFNGYAALAIIHKTGGPTVTGQRAGLVVQQWLTANTAVVSEKDIGGATFEVFGLVGNNGANYIAASSTAYLDPAAVGAGGLSGYEIDMVASAGSTVANKFGLTIVQASTDAVHGSSVDAGIAFYNNGTAGWNSGILFNSATIATGGVGIDMSAVALGGPAYLFKGPSSRFYVDGNGNVGANSLNILGGATSFLIVNGSTSGTGQFIVPAALGSPIWTMPTNTGTFVVTASSPLSRNAATGDVALNGVVPLANGGTNASSASGTALDNISGFSGIGFIKRTGAGTYTFTADPSDVTSVFGRTGAVVAAANDYNFNQLAGSNSATQIAGSAASHAVPIDVAGTPTWKVISDCNGATTALNYTQSSDAFSCNSSITAADVANAPVIAKVLTGFTSGPGTVSAADSILSAFQKINGNDLLKAPIANPTFTGTPAAPTAAVDTNTTQIASTAFVLAQAASATPLIDGTAAVGTSTRYARGDHVHPTDTTRAPVAGRTSGAAVSAGNIGEVLSTIITLDSVSITTGTPANLGSLSLTAGDWDVQGVIYYLPGATTVTQYVEASLGTTSGTRNLTEGAFAPLFLGSVSGNAGRFSATTPVQQINVSGTTSVFLVSFDIHTVSTMVAGGKIFARRRS